MASVKRFPQSLADVVSAAKERHNVTSGRGLEAVSRNLDIFISYTVLNEIEAGTYRRRMSPDTRERLAKLAGVNRRVVDQLAGAPLGAPFRLPEDDASTLTGEQREAVLNVVRAFANLNRRVLDVEEDMAAMELNPGGTPPGQSEESDT